MQAPIKGNKPHTQFSTLLWDVLYSALTKFFENKTKRVPDTLKYLPIFSLLALSACAQLGSSVDPERFQINSDGTVLDKETDLMWAAEDTSQSMTWAEAGEYCTSYSSAGHQDWRVPAVSELAALLEAGIRKNEAIIRISGDRIWASETDDSTGAFCSFHGTGCGWLEKVVSISLHALPVRDTKAAAASTASTAGANDKPQSIEQRLQVLDLLHKQQLITGDEYDRKKAAILNEL